MPHSEYKHILLNTSSQLLTLPYEDNPTHLLPVKSYSRGKEAHCIQRLLTSIEVALRNWTIDPENPMRKELINKPNDCQNQNREEEEKPYFFEQIPTSSGIGIVQMRLQMEVMS